MKKILFVIQSLRIGGAERLQVTLANKLVDSGYDVTIVTWKPMIDLKCDLDERVHFIYREPNQHLGAKIPYIRYKFYDDCMWELRASPKKLYKYYVKGKFDVEIAFFHGLAVQIVGGSTNKRAKKIAWIHHDMENQTDAIPENWDKYIKLYKKMDNIVCVSNAARQSYINVVGDTGNVTTIYNMLPFDQIRKKAAQEPDVKVNKAAFHVVTVGRFNKLKGYERLFRCISALRKEGKDISLLYVGGGEKKPVDDYIRELGAEDCVFTVEGGSNPYPYMKDATLSVCASYSEGYNLTIAEAMVLGIPVLSTDCAGPREILDGGKYGLLVENSEDALLNGLRKLYDDPALLKEYRVMTTRRIKFFDDNTALKQIAGVFEDKKTK